MRRDRTNLDSRGVPLPSLDVVPSILLFHDLAPLPLAALALTPPPLAPLLLVARLWLHRLWALPASARAYPPRCMRAGLWTFSLLTPSLSRELSILSDVSSFSRATSERALGRRVARTLVSGLIPPLRRCDLGNSQLRQSAVAALPGHL